MPYVTLVTPAFEYEVNGKSVAPGVPVNLTVEERKSFEDRGFVFEKSSKSEAESVDSTPGLPVGNDVASAGPAFEQEEDPNQDQPGDKPQKSSRDK